MMHNAPSSSSAHLSNEQTQPPTDADSISTPAPINPCIPIVGRCTMLSYVTFSEYRAILSPDLSVRDFTIGDDIPKHDRGKDNEIIQPFRHGTGASSTTSLNANSPYGDWFQYIPLEKQVLLPIMSHAISVALGRDKVFAPGSQEHISARSITDGYHALHAIVRSVHPALNPYQRSCTPVQRPEESFLSFVTRMKTYAYDECVSFRNGHYEDRQLILLTLGNCHPRYAWVVQLFFKDRVLRLEPGDMLPFELHMDQMAGTLDQAVARVGLCPLHSSSRHGTDRDIYGNDADDDDVDELSMDDQIELCIYRRLAATTASSSKTVGGDCCRISHNTGHAMDECCSLVVHVLATLELVDQPAVRGRILDKQKRIVGTPGS